MFSSSEIADKAKIQPIAKIAKKLGIQSDEYKLFGEHIAKIDLKILDRIKNRPKGKYILVTAITPTHFGEGKTTTAIGLSMALNRMGKLTTCCLRQASTGPVFGIKGAATGSGYSQILPAEELNLHFTGDIHAVGLAHNLCAAYLYNALWRGNKLNIDHQKIYWRRVVDVSDRFLRNIKTGFGSTHDGFPSDSGFDITVASEVMAILALSRNYADLRERLAKIHLADTHSGRPITPLDIKVNGAMAVILKDAKKPNLVQTLENTPCFVHTGPFGNIAHGSSSILADEIALPLSDFVVTESGFGVDLGAEKFFDIKCHYSGLKPDCAVVVASIRALKMHSGRFDGMSSRELDPCLEREDLAVLEEGLCNLKKQIENVHIFGVPAVVAINRFNSDTEKELALVIEKAKEFGARDCVVSEVWLKGSKGGLELASAVIKAADEKSEFKPLYSLESSIKEKIKTIATKIYGARSVEYTRGADEKIALFTQHGWARLPICMAKTHLSLSDAPHIKGAPRDFILPVRDIRAAVGAGFLLPLCGTIQTMPGLPRSPRGEKMDIDDAGNIKGLL
ncbi:MAG: formate--tetrahydrofolate ligase [Candidatus Omnitrophica bacterium]|nr:formate--tetrahydrofolate ligase [Candidatus Omnitrophota bacterium]